MPSVAVKLYSVFFKLLLKHKLQNRLQAADDPFGVTCRPEESTAPANPSFGADGVATKDIHIDPLTALSVRIFLPDTSLGAGGAIHRVRSLDPDLRRNSYGAVPSSASDATNHSRRNSYEGPGSGAQENGSSSPAANGNIGGNGAYMGYLPSVSDQRQRPGGARKLPVIIQFHGGGFIAGSNTSTANDFFCRRIAKLLDVIVIAVGYRLAPESRYPAAFDDGLKVLNWLGKQANLAECSKSMGNLKGAGGSEARRSQIVDTFGASTVEPWLAAHGDPSRCVLLGVSCGANIADFVARKSVEAGKLIEPVKVVAQVLMYPFFIGSVPTHSEIKLANSYFYDKSTCILAWKLFLPEQEFSLDHPAANPLVPGRGPPLKFMPATLTVVAEHDWMRDRAIAARYLVVASGENDEVVVPEIPGMDGFVGPVVHSSQYRSGSVYNGSDVLVVGSGNSGMEIAYDLAQCGARPTIVVRNQLHIVSRDIWLVGMILAKILPCNVVDTLVLLLCYMKFGDTSKYGFHRPKEGPFYLKIHTPTYPIVDIGTLKMVKSGKIQVRTSLKSIKGNYVTFSDGTYQHFDAVVLATGYRSAVKKWLKGDEYLIGGDGMAKQHFPSHWKGRNGLYCAGFVRRGIYGSGEDAEWIAKDISGIEANMKAEE